MNEFYDLIGITETAACKLLETRMQDHEYYRIIDPLSRQTLDYNSNRINLFVDNDIVIRVTRG